MARELLTRRSGCVVLENVLTTVVGDQSRDRAQRGRLPRAVRADQRDPLAALDLVGQRVEDACAAERDGHAVERQRCHAVRLVVRSTTAKNGAPKNAVTTPIGSSAGDITVRAITSAKTRKPAPTITDSGSSSL